jgi:hypothetical protein
MQLQRRLSPLIHIGTRFGGNWPVVRGVGDQLPRAWADLGGSRQDTQALAEGKFIDIGCGRLERGRRKNRPMGLG